MDSEISVKIAFNDEMRRFSFQGTSFTALRDHVIGLLNINNPDNVVLKYTDEDGDLITLSSDLELKTAVVPGKVLRLQVTQKNAVPAPTAVEPMDIQRQVPNPFGGFANGCAAPPAHPHPPPGFFGQPQPPFPHHGHPHHRGPHHGGPHGGPHHGPHHGGPHHGPHGGPHHGPYHQKPKHEWAKIKEERKKAKKNLSKEEYEKYKEQHKAEYKQQKQAFKEAMKGKKGKWGKHHGGHHPHPHHARGFPPHMGMPFAPPPFGGPAPAPGVYPGFGFQQGGFGGPQAGEKLVARHVKDVTVEDGMQLPPNTPFTKTWRVRNEGPAWPAGCRLYFVSKRCGDILGGPEYVTVEGTVQPNQEVDISVNLVSPNKPGKYTGFWRFCQPDGRKFGQRMWVSIVVPAIGSSSSDEEERLADKYEVLVDSVLALGFTAKRHRVFRLLQKCDGNVEEVANILAEKSQRKADKADRACRD